MTPEDERENAAHEESLKAVPYTCGFVMDVVVYLKDKYEISESDYDYAYWMVTMQTKRLRRALVREIQERQAGTPG